MFSYPLRIQQYLSLIRLMVVAVVTISYTLCVRTISLIAVDSIFASVLTTQEQPQVVVDDNLS